MWFNRTFQVFGRLQITQNPLFTGVEATAFYIGVPGQLSHIGLMPGTEEVYQVVIGRGAQGGWVFVASKREAASVDLVLPVCTKFQIVIFQNSGCDTQLEDDFLQEIYEGDSDKEVQTFVLSLEGL